MCGCRKALCIWPVCWTCIRASASAGGLSRRIDAQLPLQALEMALAQRVIPAGLIHHSDRGRQYCSHAYVERLLDVGANISMSTPGQPTENAFAESFSKTVKCKEVYLYQYQTFEEAQARLKTFLEDVYNTKCLHSSLDYVPPDEFEFKYAMCERLGRMDFLGALHDDCCQFCCQQEKSGQIKKPEAAFCLASGFVCFLIGAKGRNRTDDTSIFSAVLYQLSYLGM